MRAFPESRSWTALAALAPVLVALAAVVPTRGWSAPSDRLQKVAAESYFDAADQQRWRYLVNLPDDYDVDRDEPWPLFVWLHGRSLRGNDLERVKRYGPPSILKKRDDSRFVFVFPQLPKGSWPPEALDRLLDEWLERYHVDPDRVYLSGVSLGAMGAWSFAAASPDRFAAFAPVCAHGPSHAAKTLTDVPIRAFHGAKDEIVPIGEHRRLIEAIEENGGEAELIVFPEGTHGSVIAPVYNDPELYEWFLDQRRDSKP